MRKNSSLNQRRAYSETVGTEMQLKRNTFVIIPQNIFSFNTAFNKKLGQQGDIIVVCRITEAWATWIGLDSSFFLAMLKRVWDSKENKQKSYSKNAKHLMPETWPLELLARGCCASNIYEWIGQTKDKDWLDKQMEKTFSDGY